MSRRKRRILEELFADGPKTASDLERDGFNRATVSKELGELDQEGLVQRAWTGSGLPQPYHMTMAAIRAIRPNWENMTPTAQMLATPMANWSDLSVDSEIVLQYLRTSLEKTYNRVRVAKLDQANMLSLWEERMSRSMPRWQKVLLRIFKPLADISPWKRHVHTTSEIIRNEHRIWKDVGTTIREHERAGLVKVTEEGLEIIQPFASQGILDSWNKINSEAGMDLPAYASTRDWREGSALTVTGSETERTVSDAENKLNLRLESRPFVSELIVERIMELERKLSKHGER